MSGIVIVGSQWGDEGKGKVVDVFSCESDCVVRYQGGANAGHTLTVGDQQTILHLIPSGILQDHTKCIIAPGVALDIETLAKEIEGLKKNGFLKDPKQLQISYLCTLIFPYHKKLDQLRDNCEGHEKIGVTGKGIGPAYEERASRRALLLGDLFQEKTLKDKIKRSLFEKNFLLENLYKQEPYDLEKMYELSRSWAETIKPYCCNNTSLLIEKEFEKGKKILFEGAQGSLLDLFHGTYPYVTSSSTLAGSACVGTGVGPQRIKKVLGITKGYTTRVGSGPFPTEIEGKLGDELQSLGGEFGATTGRKRRCGWLDLVALKYAIRINGISSIALMKLDVLSSLKEIKVCTHYELDGKRTDEYFVSMEKLERVKPIYKSFPGWGKDISSSKKTEDLPKEALQYVDFIRQETETPIDVISIGPKRKQTLWLRPLF